MTEIEFWVDIAQIVASIGVIIALLFTGISFIRLRKTEQIKLAEKFHSDMQQILKDESDYFDLDPHQKDYQDRLDLLDKRIYGTLEWNAYLILTKEIKDRSLINHFRNRFLDWYDNGFLISDKLEEYKGEYPEFQRLVKDFKEGKKYKEKKRS